MGAYSDISTIVKKPCFIGFYYLPPFLFAPFAHVDSTAISSTSLLCFCRYQIQLNLLIGLVGQSKRKFV